MQLEPAGRLAERTRAVFAVLVVMRRAYDRAGPWVAYVRGKTPNVNAGAIMIRTAAAADLAAVGSCDPVAATGDAERASFLARAIEQGWCLIGVDGPDVVGFVVTTPGHFFGRDFVELLVVSPARRREGIGRSILRAAVGRAAGTDVWSSTNRSNAAMRDLLGGEGWIFSGEIAGLDDDDPELFFHTSRFG